MNTYLLHRVPPLCFEVELVAVACDELCAQFGTRDVANHLDVIQLFHFLMVSQRNGEEQFIILTSIERSGVDVHIKLLSRTGRLIVDRNTLFIDAAARMALFADVHGLRR